jgi:serine/threonine-protein kinase HipA
MDISVYADWDGLPDPVRLGLLHVRRGSGREIFEFEFDGAALAMPALLNVTLDPRLGPFEGRQHPPQNAETFGVFADASPDRWGRLLMRRRFEREQRAGQVPKNARLHESDYLLGVHDAFRAGALRFKRGDTGVFYTIATARQRLRSCSCASWRPRASRWSGMKTTRPLPAAIG